MADTLDKRKVVQVAEIVYHGDALQIPEKMTVDQAIGHLLRHQEEQEKKIAMVRDYSAYPIDGAVALRNVLQKKYGWVEAKPTPSFFGDTPPMSISVEVGPRKKEQVLWGRMALPGLTGGYVDTGVGKKGQRFFFKLSGEVKRKHEKDVIELFDLVEKELKAHSIYKGKAVRIRLTATDNKTGAPEPQFLETDNVDVSRMIYPVKVEEQLNTSVFTPISRMQDCRNEKIPIKRGVIFAGPFGVGKTLAARAASRYAVDAGVTYIYCPQADELAGIVEFARQYEPAVVFCEDIDRETSGERTATMDELLNILDGVDSKTSEIIVVLTTNDIGKMNPAVLRPGRVDAIIEIERPDPDAVQRLIRMYGGENIDPDAKLEEVGISLAGSIPAVIEEVVKRAKLAQLTLTPKGQRIGKISAKALQVSADSMKTQQELLEDKRIPETPDVEKALVALLAKVIDNSTEAIAEKVNEVING